MATHRNSFQPRHFDVIRDGTSASWLADSLQVSEENGVLAICKVNLVHAVILFEYLKRPVQITSHPDNEVTQQELQRTIIKIDFGPAHKKYSIIGKGKAQFNEFLGQEIISQKIRNLVVGAYWFSETKNVLGTFAKIKDEIDNGEAPTYSSSGSGSFGGDSGFANCLTYAVDTLGRYASDLKIEDWEPSNIFKVLPLPNIWIRFWHRTQKQ